jgi:hypothetical protein
MFVIVVCDKSITPSLIISYGPMLISLTFGKYLMIGGMTKSDSRKEC